MAGEQQDAGIRVRWDRTEPEETIRRAKPDELLNIAKRVDQFVSDNGWSWCDMKMVYRILETIHG